MQEHYCLLGYMALKHTKQAHNREKFERGNDIHYSKNEKCTEGAKTTTGQTFFATSPIFKSVSDKIFLYHITQNIFNAFEFNVWF